MPRRIILIGATGFFGRRLARRLMAIDGIALTLTSRSLTRAEALAKELGGADRCDALAFDRDDAASLKRVAARSPWLVIDASGPFQSAGYDLARFVTALGSHWIDLADARDYLIGFNSALDDLAREKGVVARAGASSTPALSMAAVEALTRGWRRIDTIDIAILPGGKGDVGLSVIRAILSYCGAPVVAFSEGRLQTTTGWGSAKRLRAGNLGVRYVSAVETADAALMAERFAVTSRISFAAGLESRLEQSGLVFLSQLRRLGLLSRLEPFASLLARGRALTKLFASDRGGMCVACTGIDADGRLVSATWKLDAKPGQGPDVPVLPAVSLTRALLRGDLEIGAEIARLPLAAIEAEMTPPALATSRTITKLPAHSLIEAACGDGYGTLPLALKAFHDQTAPPVWEGEADIDAAQSLLGRMVRRMFGFPPSGRNVPVTVTVDRDGVREIWTRNFGGQRFRSSLQHNDGNIVSERFGAFSVQLKLRAGSGEIEMPVVGWRIGPLRLPLFLAPKSETREFADDGGRFHFDVEIRLPLIGRLAHYRGWLEPKPVGARETVVRETN